MRAPVSMRAWKPPTAIRSRRLVTVQSAPKTSKETTFWVLHHSRRRSRSISSSSRSSSRGRGRGSGSGSGSGSASGSGQVVVEQ